MVQSQSVSNRLVEFGEDEPIQGGLAALEFIFVWEFQ
jgi:hypothetical protein